MGLPMISQGHVGSHRSPTPLSRRHQGPKGEEQIATQLGPRLAAPSFISHRWGQWWGLCSLLSIEAQEPLPRAALRTAYGARLAA